MPGSGSFIRCTSNGSRHGQDAKSAVVNIKDKRPSAGYTPMSSNSTGDQAGGSTTGTTGGDSEANSHVSTGTAGVPAGTTHRSRRRRKAERQDSQRKSYSVTDLSTLAVKSKSCASSDITSPATPDDASAVSEPKFFGSESPHDASGTRHTKDLTSPPGLKRRSHNERRFHKLFQSIPQSEVLLSRFSCAYVGDMGLLVQGYLYLSYNWICFHSNIFGIEKVFEVPVDTVTRVSKEKTAKIIPNAVGIWTNVGKSYIFGSLMSRDNTHQLLLSIVSRKQAKDPSFYSLGGESCLPDEIDPQALVGDDSCSESSSFTSECSESECSVISSTAEKNKVYTHRVTIGASGAIDPTSGRLTSNSLISKNGSLSSYLSAQAVITWFISLPRVMMFLVVSVVILIFLFGCATLLTMKLMYLHRNHANSYGSSLKESPFRNIPPESLRRIESAVDGTLALVSEARKHLESLRVEVRASATSHLPLTIQEVINPSTVETGRAATGNVPTAQATGHRDDL